MKISSSIKHNLPHTLTTTPPPPPTSHMPQPQKKRRTVCFHAAQAPLNLTPPPQPDDEHGHDSSEEEAPQCIVQCGRRSRSLDIMSGSGSSQPKELEHQTKGLQGDQGDDSGSDSNDAQQRRKGGHLSQERVNKLNVLCNEFLQSIEE